MDSATLADVMGHVVPQAAYDRYVAPFNNAMIAANITTVNRAAMWCAQLGHESVGLKYMKEVGSAAYFARYNNRRDLGNGPKDGPIFPGRGPIQLTGRHNYAVFSQWCYAKGYVTSSDYFVRNPTAVEDPHWGFLAASWYWVVARPQLNTQADRGDLVAATKSINGGTNGLADRSARYKRALTFGARLLPAGVTEEDELNDTQARQLADVAARIEKFDLLERDLRSDLNDKHAELDQIRDDVKALNAKVDKLVTALTNAQSGQQP